MKPPCKGCENREQNCHASCELYLEYSSSVKAMRKKRRQHRIIEETMWDMAKKKK